MQQQTQQTTKTEKSKKDLKKRDSLQQAAFKQVLMNNNIMGVSTSINLLVQFQDGLWCMQSNQSTQFCQQQKAQNSIQAMKYSEKIFSRKEKEMNDIMDSDIKISLEKYCNDLGIQMEQQQVLIQNQKIEIARLGSIINESNQVKIKNQTLKQLETANLEIQKLRNLRQSLECQVDSIKDLYYKAKKEISGLIQQLDQEKNQKEELQKYLQQKQLDELQWSNEKKNLKNQIEELEEENEEYRNQMQIRNNLEQKFDNEKSKIGNDLHQLKSTENKLQKMGKLLQENMVLNEKLGESDVLKKKFMERNQLQEKELKKLAEQYNEIQKQNLQMKKRLNDLSIMKSSNTKILEERINKLQQLNDTIAKENERNKKIIQKFKIKIKLEENPNDEVEELIEIVEAKPQLFGI